MMTRNNQNNRQPQPLKTGMPALSSFQVVVLMGGIGSRLGEITASVPKSMLPSHGNPFFLYQLMLLIMAGFRNFLFLVGYRAEQVEEYFGDGSKFGVKIEYSYDGEKRLGTAGAVVKAYDKLDNSFLLMYGDTLLDVDYFEIVYRFCLGKQNGYSSLMTVYRNNGQFDTSNVLLDTNDEIIEYNKENPREDMHYIDYGISVFDKKVFSTLSRCEAIDLSYVQMKLASEGSMAACIIRKRFYEIGTPASFKSFKDYIEKRFFQSNKAVFLDRDGVINEIVLNENTEQLDSPLNIEEFCFIDGAIEGLKKLQNKGYKLFIVTNQPAAAKGKVPLSTLYDINGYMLDELEWNGIEVDALSVCPHHPVGAERTQERFLIQKCDCRKPSTGMLLDILKKYNINKSSSFMIGDSLTDILAGRRAGLKTAFIGDFKCDICQKLNEDKPEIIAKNLLELSEKL